MIEDFVNDRNAEVLYYLKQGLRVRIRLAEWDTVQKYLQPKLSFYYGYRYVLLYGVMVDIQC